MTFYFYDLETSGFNPRTDRIMQFAGVRTDADFNEIGKPLNCLVKLTPEVLPDPGAIMVTGITPQRTLEEGYTEAEFLKLFTREALQPDTVLMGFNTIRFDDEFMRHALYRNFYDPYEWHYQDGRGRWDILDATRMTRALRPDGIEWPFDKDGKPTNRLELLTAANKLDHSEAHDALSDVRATIAVAKLLKTKQEKLYNWLVEHRSKDALRPLLDPGSPTPVVYSAGRLSSEFLKTSVVIPLAPHPTNTNSVIVYDLRFDPTPFADLDVNQLNARMFARYEDLAEQGLERLPVKAVALNKSPAVAPLGVLDQASQERIKLDVKTVEANLKKLAGLSQFSQRIHQAFDQSEPRKPYPDVDGQIYEGFLNDSDKKLSQEVRKQDRNSLADYQPKFIDERLDKLLLRYKARNYPESLNAGERELWEAYRLERLSGGVPGLSLTKYFERLAQMAAAVTTNPDKQFILEELQLYGESIAPSDD